MWWHTFRGSKICDSLWQGEGGSKIIKNSVTYFMDGPIAHITITSWPISHTLNAQKTCLKSSLRFLSLKDTPHIHLANICSALQTMQIFSLHCPCFSPICRLLFYMIGCTADCRDGRYLPELSPSTSHSTTSHLFKCHVWKKQKHKWSNIESSYFARTACSAAAPACLVSYQPSYLAALIPGYAPVRSLRSFSSLSIRVPLRKISMATSRSFSSVVSEL